MKNRVFKKYTRKSNAKIVNNMLAYLEKLGYVIGDCKSDSTRQKPSFDHFDIFKRKNYGKKSFQCNG